MTVGTNNFCSFFSTFPKKCLRLFQLNGPNWHSSPSEVAVLKHLCTKILVKQSLSPCWGIKTKQNNIFYCILLLTEMGQISFFAWPMSFIKSFYWKQISLHGEKIVWKIRANHKKSRGLPWPCYPKQITEYNSYWFHLCLETKRRLNWVMFNVSVMRERVEKIKYLFFLSNKLMKITSRPLLIFVDTSLIYNSQSKAKIGLTWFFYPPGEIIIPKLALTCGKVPQFAHSCDRHSNHPVWASLFWCPKTFSFLSGETF